MTIWTFCEYSGLKLRSETEKTKDASPAHLCHTVGLSHELSKCHFLLISSTFEAPLTSVVLVASRRRREFE